MAKPNVYPVRSSLNRTLGNSPEQWIRRNRRRFARPSPLMRQARAIAARARRRAAVVRHYMVVMNDMVDAITWVAMEHFRQDGEAERGK